MDPFGFSVVAQILLPTAKTRPRQTDRPTDGYRWTDTDMQTANTETDGQADRQIDVRQMGRHTDGQRDKRQTEKTNY